MSNEAVSCGAGVESSLHALRDCNFANITWMAAIPRQVIGN